jgi:hypothetical protein
MKADRRKRHKSILLTLTIALSLLVLFILAAFTYVAAVTYLTIDNKIDLDVARATASAGPGNAAAAYSIDSWTPETWYQALVLLPLDESNEVELVRRRVGDGCVEGVDYVVFDCGGGGVGVDGDGVFEGVEEGLWMWVGFWDWGWDWG